MNSDASIGTTYAIAWIKSDVQTPIGAKSCNPVARCASDAAEITTDQNPTIWLQSKAINHAVYQTRIKGGVQAAVRIEPSDATSVRCVHSSEISCNQDLRVRLHCKGSHLIVCTRAEIESWIKSAVSVETGNAVARCAIKRVEQPSN